MEFWRQVKYLASRLKRTRAEKELDDEIRAHLDFETDLNLENGMPAAQARTAALRQFGSVALAKEDSRQVWGFMLIENFWRDVKYAVRLLIKKPGFTAIAVLTLAIGIGANTAVFSIVNSVLLKPLPYPNAQRLVQPIWQLTGGEEEGASDDEFGFSKRNVRSFELTAAYAGITSGFNLAGGTDPVRVKGLRVTDTFFQVLGIPPARGHDFAPADNQPNAACVCIISDALWRGYFGADSSIIGRSIQVNGKDAAIVGVLPPSFHFDPESEVFMPMAVEASAFDQGNTDVFARLKPGVTLQQAQSEIDSLAPEFLKLHPKFMGGQATRLRLAPMKDSVVADAGHFLILIFVAVGFVLAVACANVAGLLFARASGRSGEMAVRLALGASRARLFRQLLAEGLVLALTGAAAGVFLAYWALPALLSLTPAELPRSAEVSLDIRAVAFAVVVSIATSFIFAIAPALLSTRTEPGTGLKDAASRGKVGRGTARTRRALIVGEVAVSLVLLAGAALLIQSLINLRSVNLGFEPQEIYAMQMSLNSDRYRTTASVWQLEQTLLDRISSIPGVDAAATVSSLPLERGLRDGATLTVNGEKRHLGVEVRAISSNYFRTFGLRMIRGREFNSTDAAGSAPVVIINETLARLYWPDADPAAHSAVYGARSQIVGVVTDVKENGLDQKVKPTVYVPMPQLQDGLTSAMDRWFLTSWVIRARNGAGLKSALAEAVRQVDPSLPIASFRPMTAVVSASISRQRFVAMLMTVFAGITLLLSSLGLYGVMSYQVSQRTAELGIRMALGAGRGTVLGMVIREGMLLTGIGLVIGVAAAIALAKTLSGMLFGVSAHDPLTLVGVSIVLGAVALLACAVPARKATRIDPVIALRYE